MEKWSSKCRFLILERLLKWTDYILTIIKQPWKKNLTCVPCDNIPTKVWWQSGNNYIFWYCNVSVPTHWLQTRYCSLVWNNLYSAHITEAHINDDTQQITINIILIWKKSPLFTNMTSIINLYLDFSLTVFFSLNLING